MLIHVALTLTTVNIVFSSASLHILHDTRFDVSNGTFTFFYPFGEPVQYSNFTLTLMPYTLVSGLITELRVTIAHEGFCLALGITSFSTLPLIF